MKTRKGNYSHTYIFSKLVFLVLTLCILVSACGRKSASASSALEPPPVAENAVNINTTSEGDLAKIPYIGENLAKKIVSHRQIHGPFRRPEHLMLVEGISDKKFRLIRGLVKTE